MEETLGLGTLFIDIGAHFGLFSLHAAKLVGVHGEVLSFEPNPDQFDSLTRSARLNAPENMTCANVALSDVNRRAAFYLARKPASSSLVPETEKRQDRYTHPIQVTCARLDDYVIKNDVDVTKISLIKCDVEGHETRVISGMLSTLAGAGFPPVWVEVRGPEGSTRAPNTFPQVNELLSPLGYQPFKWADGQLNPIEDRAIVGREDVIFHHETKTNLSCRST